MLRHRQPPWVRSPHESRPRTYTGELFRRYNRRTGAADLMIVFWLGIVLAAAVLFR
jgi:hypothetical protein